MSRKEICVDVIRMGRKRSFLSCGIVSIQIVDRRSTIAVNSIILMPERKTSVKKMRSGEFGPAGREFESTPFNIEVDNPQGIFFEDFHNSHNRIYDWIDKTVQK